MDLTDDLGDRAHRIVLAETLNLAEARALTERLLALRGSDVAVDASEVGFVGASCAQVLVSAARTWEVDGHAFVLEAQSPHFLQALSLLGLASSFEVGA